jgi:hypothetical protein
VTTLDFKNIVSRANRASVIRTALQMPNLERGLKNSYHIANKHFS